MGDWYGDEQKKIRRIAQRLLPDMHIIFIPSELAMHKGDKGELDYFTKLFALSIGAGER